MLKVVENIDVDEKKRMLSTNFKILETELSCLNGLYKTLYRGLLFQKYATISFYFKEDLLLMAQMENLKVATNAIYDFFAEILPKLLSLFLTEYLHLKTPDKEERSKIGNPVEYFMETRNRLFGKEKEILKYIDQK